MNQNINTTVSAISQVVTGIGAADLTTESQNLLDVSASTMVPEETTILNCFTTFDDAFSTETGCVWFSISLIWAALSIVIILILLIALCCYCCRSSGSDNES